MSASAPLDAIVLAGGLGTRLQTTLPNQQKVTAKIGGEPFLVKLIRRLADAGVRRVVLAVGHRAEDVMALVSAHSDARLQLVTSVETAPLGTGGATRLAFMQTESDPVLVMNGDSYCDIDLDAFRAFHATHAEGVSL